VENRVTRKIRTAMGGVGVPLVNLYTFIGQGKTNGEVSRDSCHTLHGPCIQWEMSGCKNKKVLERNLRPEKSCIREERNRDKNEKGGQSDHFHRFEGDLLGRHWLRGSENTRCGHSRKSLTRGTLGNRKLLIVTSMNSIGRTTFLHSQRGERGGG